MQRAVLRGPCGAAMFGWGGWSGEILSLSTLIPGPLVHLLVVSAHSIRPHTGMDPTGTLFTNPNRRAVMALRRAGAATMTVHLHLPPGL